jgi:hypothetical protein
MPKKQKKGFAKGDQMHFVITDNFVATANEFISYCDANAINASGAIRNAIADWLGKKLALEKRIEKLERGTSSLQELADSYERDVLKEVEER